MLRGKKKMFLLLLIPAIMISQKNEIDNNDWKLLLDNNGDIESVYFKENKSLISFNKNGYKGPSWYTVLNDSTYEIKSEHKTPGKFAAHFKDLELSLEYKNDKGRLLIEATIANNGTTPYQPEKLGLRLGVDVYMDHYPNWEAKLFPTLLRCEPTHFWGYFMSPKGKILTIGSPDPIASWSHDYSKSWGTPPYQYNGHRITSVNLDLINALPLPNRHPQNLYQVKPQETKVFHIYLDEVDNLDMLYDNVSATTEAPMVDIKSTTVAKNSALKFSVITEEPAKTMVLAPDGTSISLEPTSYQGSKYYYFFDDTDMEGLYEITSKSSTGRKSEAIFYVRKPYSWYMQKAMDAVAKYPQKASVSHCESWYGLYTLYAGGEHFPNNKNIEDIDKRFGLILNAAFDTISLKPKGYGHRIQNASSMMGILVDRYRLFHNKKDLESAIKLADFLIASQTSDGAYRAHKTHYTSVIYIAKSLMELMEVLKENEGENQSYKSAYDRIYKSVKLAMDELERNRTNIQTEGEQTFEDGMISCSALQLGEFALLQKNKKDKEHYKDAAIDMLQQHECLEQLKIPDTRMRSGSLRFWEAQYDVMMDNNFFNSTHGWSSWATYANYYAYLLTGDVKYLERTFNGLNAAMQSIDLDTGDLRWAFMVNPYINVTQIDKNIEGVTPDDFITPHHHALENSHSSYVMGEDYVDMVSDWFFANANDNDVHEHFKALEEIALTNAFIYETEDGEIEGYNCSISTEDGKIIVLPNEKLVSNVHYNLSDKKDIEVVFSTKTINKKVKGLGWIRE